MLPLDVDAMRRTDAPEAAIIPFPKLTRRGLAFSRAERQALLALTYAVPGTQVDVSADACGDECALLGAEDFADGAWWTVLVTPTGFDVVNFMGYRVARFADVRSLAASMRPHMSYMLNQSLRGASGVDGQAAGPRPLTVV